MYLPKHFSEEDRKAIEALVREHPFAMVLSFPGTEPVFVNHLPIIFEGEGEAMIGHMAKRNSQWQHFQKDPRATLIFRGPHTYITPTWYRSGRDVPTWNYAVVEMQGRMTLLEGFDDQIEVLKKLSLEFEGKKEGAWEFELPEDLNNPNLLTNAIISFRFVPEKIEAKFKLSQNRNQADREGVLAGLAERGDENSAAIRRLMQELS